MQLDNRSAKLLSILIESSSPIIIEDLCEQLDISRRNFYYALGSLNEWLDFNDFSQLVNVRGIGILLDIKEKTSIKIKMKESQQIVYSQDERASILLYILLSNQEDLHIYSFSEILDVSRNTLFNDMKRVRDILNEYDLDIEYIYNEGYKVIGDVIKMRTAFLYVHWDIVKLIEQDRLNVDEQFIVFNFEHEKLIYDRLKEVEAILNTSYVIGTITALSSLINIITSIPQEGLHFDDNQQYLYSTKEYEAIKEVFPELSRNEQLYFSLHLLGARTQIPNERINMPSLSNLAVELVNEFERISAVRFREKTKLIKQISSHLSVSYFRYKYGIYHGNPLTEHIKKEYESVFKLVNIACDLIRVQLEIPVHDGEVALITLHFSSYLERKTFDSNIALVDIVCPSGISTSNMILTEVINLHPQIRVGKVMGLDQYHREGSKAEMIISTIKLEEVKHIVVNPIINNQDKKNILRALNLNDKTIHDVTVNDIMLLISPYIRPGMKDLTKQTLVNYFDRDVEVGSKHFRLLDILTPNLVNYVDTSVEWEEAIHIGAKPLIDDGSIEESYVDAMISSTNKFGPYMVLDNGYILMHASYRDGVNNLAINYTHFKEDIKLGSKVFNKMIILAPVDEHKHIDIMKDLMTIFTSDTLHKELDSKACSEEIYTLLEDYVKFAEY